MDIIEDTFMMDKKSFNPRANKKKKSNKKISIMLPEGFNDF